MKLAFPWRPVDFVAAYAACRCRAVVDPQPRVSRDLAELVAAEPLLVLALYSVGTLFPTLFADFRFWGRARVCVQLRDAFIGETLALTPAQIQGFRDGLSGRRDHFGWFCSVARRDEYRPAHEAGVACRYLMQHASVVRI